MPAEPREFTFRAAKHGDGARIVAIFRAAMPAPVVALNVLGTPKAAVFVDAGITAAASGGSDRYWVAEGDDGQVVGFAQLRLGRTTFINNLHVAPGYQGHRIGDRLMRLMTSVIPSNEVAADVFEGSDVSRGMFERAGFRVVDRFHWHVYQPKPEGVGWYAVHDLPQADVTHAAFDLSTFHVETATATHRVGRIGQNLFRLVGSSAVNDPDLRPALHRLDPSRSLLVILPDADDVSPLKPRLVSSRLTAPRDSVAARYGA